MKTDMIKRSRLNEGSKKRLAEKLIKARKGGGLSAAYFGGSITEGSQARPHNCYTRLVTDWFEQQFENSKINYINAGIGATGSYIGVHRAEADVISQNPDIVFVEFSVNDTDENINRNKNSYDSLLRKLWLSSSSPAIIAIGMTEKDGTSFQSRHIKIARHYDIPYISYRNAVHGYIDWSEISNDDIHPNTAGHKLLSELIITYLEDVGKEKIKGEESDFSVPFSADLYKEARLIEVANNKDWFGGFEGYRENEPLKLKINAKNIALLYGKLTKNAGKLKIIIDGKYSKTLNTAFSNGWGDYTEVKEIAAFGKKGKHTLEIIPIFNKGQRVIISRIGVS